MVDTRINEFKELYFTFYKNISDSYTECIVPFFMQKGKTYHESSPKCLFIGKAVNGWVTKSRNVDELFDMNNKDRIVDRPDEIKWVEDCAGNSEHYNSKRSAFWRVVKSIASDLFSWNDWYNHIAWTNIYKFCPTRGNPGSRLKNMQIDICNSILDKEIEYLSPHFIIFLTSEWEQPYMNHLGLEKNNPKCRNWSKYTLYYQQKNNITYIQSRHPQGKNEGTHVDAILKVINGSIL